MMDMTINERLAILETKMDEVQNNAAIRDKKQDDILEKLNTLLSDMKSAKSFMGGAMWIGVGMVTVIWKIIPWALNFFKAKTGNG